MNLLKEAKKIYKVGDMFYSATGNLKSAMTVNELRLSENYPNTVVNEAGGVLMMEEEKTILVEDLNENGETQLDENGQVLMKEKVIKEMIYASKIEN